MFWNYESFEKTSFESAYDRMINAAEEKKNKEKLENNLAKLNSMFETKVNPTNGVYGI